MKPDDLAASLAGLRAAAAENERPPELGLLEITVTPRVRLTPEVAAAFAALGVDRLVPFPPPTRDGITATIDAAVDAVANL